MPRYYCDYCDTYLTHDSPSVRKQHNAGYKHKANVRSYYQQFEEQQTQSLIDQRIKEHLGQAAAIQQVGGPFAVWQRSRPLLATPPTLPLPGPIPGAAGAPTVPSMRPPVLPRPIAPGFGPVPILAPIPAPGGLLTAPLQTNGPPVPTTISMPPTVPGATANPGSNATSATGGQPVYQTIPSSGSFATPNIPAIPSFHNPSGN